MNVKELEYTNHLESENRNRKKAAKLQAEKINELWKTNWRHHDSRSKNQLLNIREEKNIWYELEKIERRKSWVTLEPVRIATAI